MAHRIPHVKPTKTVPVHHRVGVVDQLVLSPLLLDEQLLRLTKGQLRARRRAGVETARQQRHRINRVRALHA